jgi:hypothetical protein
MGAALLTGMPALHNQTASPRSPRAPGYSPAPEAQLAPWHYSALVILIKDTARGWLLAYSERSS